MRIVSGELLVEHIGIGGQSRTGPRCHERRVGLIIFGTVGSGARFGQGLPNLFFQLTGLRAEVLASGDRLAFIDGW